MHKVLKSLAILGVVGLAVGCSSGGGGSSGGTESSQAAGEHIRVVIPTEPATMNPVRSVVSDARLWGAVMESLVGYDKNGVINKNGLLTGWERISPETWQFDVRSGVKFHDGEAFDANAVKFTIETYVGDKATRSGAFLKVITNIEVVSPEQIKITTATPYGPLPAVFSQIFALPPKYYAEHGGDDFGKAPVGTGPFKFVNYQLGQSITVEAFKDYWGGAPPASGIDFQFAADPQSRIATLQSNAADIILDVPPGQIAAIKENPKLKVEETASTSKMMLILDSKAPPFDDRQLRKAVALSIDRKTLVDAIFQGTSAKPSNYFIGDLMQDSGAGSTIEFDLDAAKAILAGYPSPPHIKLSYTSGSYVNDARVGEAIAGMLEAAGFVVERDTMDVAQMVEKQAELSMRIYQVVPVYLSPDVYTAYFLGSAARSQMCNTPKIDELKASLPKAADDAAAEAIYREIENEVLNVEICTIPLFSPVSAYGLSQRVGGFVAPANQLVDWRTVTLTG